MNKAIHQLIHGKYKLLSTALLNISYCFVNAYGLLGVTLKLSSNPSQLCEFKRLFSNADNSFKKVKDYVKNKSCLSFGGFFSELLMRHRNGKCKSFQMLCNSRTQLRAWRRPWTWAMCSPCANHFSGLLFSHVQHWDVGVYDLRSMIR